MDVLNEQFAHEMRHAQIKPKNVLVDEVAFVFDPHVGRLRKIHLRAKIPNFDFAQRVARGIIAVPLPCVVQERCVTCSLIFSALHCVNTYMEAESRTRQANRVTNRLILTAKLSGVYALPPIDRPVWTIA